MSNALWSLDSLGIMIGHRLTLTIRCKQAYSTNLDAWSFATALFVHPRGEDEYKYCFWIDPWFRPEVRYE